MVHLDAMRNPLKDGLYRDVEDTSYILYLFNDGGRWKFQTPDFLGEHDFPLNFSKDLIPFGDIVTEIEHFRDLKKESIASFIKKKIEEDIEDRRRLQ